MMILKDKYLKKIFFVLINMLLILIIIKECKLFGFCYGLISILLPVVIGYVISWLLKPIMLKFNKRFNTTISILLTYLILIGIIGLLGYFLIPIIIKEIKNIIPYISNIYKKLPNNIKSNININSIGKKALIIFNNITNDFKNVLVIIFYSLFISYFFLVNHKEVSYYIGKHLPHDLVYDISMNLKAFVRGTLIDTIILFIMSLISFYLVKMPYSLLFAIIISITNIIPYIGPYIGGIPACIVAFSVSSKLGIIILSLIIVLQFIESSFIHPIIMSKSLNISPLFIILGIIIFSHFFGVIGMVISTPLVSIIKSCYIYYKHKKITH